MNADKKRVQFRAPPGLIDRTDALGTVLGEDRTDILVTALREYLQAVAHDETLVQEIAAAYYDDEISRQQPRPQGSGLVSELPLYPRTAVG